jgi:uncharacterized protein
MPREIAHRAVDLALGKAPRTLAVSFFGGEPLLHVDWIRGVVEYVERRLREPGQEHVRTRFVMNTNATLVDDRAVALMAPPRPFTVFVSLDGDAATHDAMRVDAKGRGTHARVCEGIERIRRAGIPFEVLAVVTTKSARALGRTVRALATTGADRLILSPNLRDDWTTESIEDLRRGLEEACDFWTERFRAGEGIRIDPLHTKILTHLYGGSPCPSRCIIGKTDFAVAPSGRLYPCAQMIGEDHSGDLVIGHVDEGFRNEIIAQIQAKKDRVEQTCAPCALRDRCQSHCGCQHLGLTGNLGEITTTLCEIEAAFIESADRLAEVLWAERCPAFLSEYYERKWKPSSGAELYPLRRARGPQ